MPGQVDGHRRAGQGHDRGVPGVGVEPAAVEERDPCRAVAPHQRAAWRPSSTATRRTSGRAASSMPNSAASAPSRSNSGTGSIGALIDGDPTERVGETPAMEALQDMFRLDGRRALVVGAGSGIGAAVAAGLAAFGATVVCADADVDAADGDRRPARWRQPRRADSTSSTPASIERGRRRRRRPGRPRHDAGGQRAQAHRRLRRRRARPRRRPQHQGHVPAVPHVRPADGRRRAGLDDRLLVDPVADDRARARAPTRRRRRRRSCCSRRSPPSSARTACGPTRSPPASSRRR